MDCLALSYDGQTLISGGSDKQIIIWNIHSHQVYKTLKFNGVITNLLIELINPNTFHVDNKPVDDLFSVKLKRIVEPMETYEDEVIDIMIKTNPFAKEDEERDNLYDKIFEYCDNLSENATNGPSLDAAEEIERLRKEVACLKLANKELFLGATKVILEGDFSETDKKRKKKSKEETVENQ